VADAWDNENGGKQKMTCMKKACLQAAVSVFAMAFTGKADIVYSVDRTVGTGSITGTITTDGTIGTLAAGDIVSYNLELTAPPSSLNLVPPANVYVQGPDLTATPTELDFNFGGPAGYFLIQNGPEDGFFYYCDQAGGGPCLNGETVAPDYFADGGLNGTISGNVVIGTAQTSATPEPTLMMLTGLGFAGVTFVAYRRRSASA
jgi:hypothetical protein